MIYEDRRDLIHMKEEYKKSFKKEHAQAESIEVNLIFLNLRYIRVHRRHIDPETLAIYDLPWDWDEVSLSGL